MQYLLRLTRLFHLFETHPHRYADLFDLFRHELKLRQYPLIVNIHKYCQRQTSFPQKLVLLKKIKKNFLKEFIRLSLNTLKQK